MRRVKFLIALCISVFFFVQLCAIWLRDVQLEHEHCRAEKKFYPFGIQYRVM